MSRFAVAVAVLVVLAGCSGLERSSDDRMGTTTMTPAPVPAGDRTAIGGRTTCLAPPAGASDRTARPTPETAGPIPGENGTVRGAALVERHLDAIAAHGFTLRTNSTRVTSLPGGTAFRFNGTLLGFGPVRLYAVGETIYRLHETDDGLSVTTTVYDPGSERVEWYLDVLTGDVWLSERVARSHYRFVETRTWNDTTVRVFESTRAVTVTENGEPVTATSTVLVDRRGILRHVRHVSRPTETDAAPRVATYTVTQVGSVTLSRPAAFCVPTSEVATPPP